MSLTLGRAALLAGIVSVTALPPTADAATRPPCSKKHTSVVRATENAQVLIRQPEGGDEVSLYGCLYEVNRPILMQRSAPDGYSAIENVRLAGRFAAFSVVDCVKIYCGRGVEVWDLRARQAVHVISPFVVSGEPPQPTDLELTEAGAVAYIDPGTGHAVYKVDGSGCAPRCDTAPPQSPATLDPGGNVDPRSLAVSGSTLYWTKGGQPRSAQLSDSASPTPAPTKTGRSNPGCSLRRSTTIAASERARVFRSRPNEDDEAKVYGCLYSRDRRFKLAETYDDADTLDVGDARLAGRFLALVVAAGGRSGQGYSIESIDLRNGMTRFSRHYQVPGMCCPYGYDNWEPDLEVKPNGSMAWINARRKLDEEGSLGYSVNRIDQTGSATLDEGADIDPESLALSGSTLYWTKGGQPHSAPLN